MGEGEGQTRKGGGTIDFSNEKKKELPKGPFALPRSLADLGNRERKTG
jgi:hypothetical protein